MLQIQNFIVIVCSIIFYWCDRIKSNVNLISSTVKYHIHQIFAVLLHLLEYLFGQKRIYDNPSPNPKRNPNPNLNPKVQ